MLIVGTHVQELAMQHQAEVTVLYLDSQPPGPVLTPAGLIHTSTATSQQGPLDAPEHHHPQSPGKHSMIDNYISTFTRYIRDIPVKSEGWMGHILTGRDRGGRVKY